MLSNVKKKDVPLIAISLAAIVFIAATLSLFPSKPRRRLIRFLTA
ncbi:transporter [Klebsiella pneumoniae]|nr:transporter [Klebsiella pneumoniae]